MAWADAFTQRGRRVLSRAELLALGATGASLTAAVRHGFLVRLRRDHYALPDTDNHVVDAVRIGGRLGCVSALADAGVFVLDARFTHVCMPPLASRPRSPRSRFVPLTSTNRDGVDLHWVELLEPDGGTEAAVSLRDALLQSLHCQSEWMSVATFDSALHQGKVSRRDIASVFAAAPERFRHIEQLLDRRAESGPESVLRMIVKSAGYECDLQVNMEGIGRVDMVVEGCLVVEADSRVGHAGWEKQRSDRSRDVALARRDFDSLRPVSEHILYSPDAVRDAITHLLLLNRRYSPR
jgi:very-short-patch-repair endonuclease